jgi:release factor glutamine methyltransferase
MSQRQLSPYELNHLLRHGLDPSKLSGSDNTPVEYLTGYVEFMSREWHVSPATLIPRIETEELLALAIQRLPATGTKPLNWLELGTGSGALGLSWAIALESQGVYHQGWLTDISSAALTVARHNHRELLPTFPNLATLTWLESDLLTKVPDELVFQVVLANLPYIPSATLPALDDSVKNFEPALALDGGPTGFEIIAAALQQLSTHLQPGSQVWLEVDPRHTPEFVRQYWPTHLTTTWPNTWKLTSFEDQFGRHRFLLVEIS